MIMIGLMVTLAITFTFTLLFSRVEATDVRITSVSPETRRGIVGEKVYIIGTINTTDGLYRIFFDDSNVNETYAIGSKVDVAFLVPLLPEGNYTIVLQDDETRNNATTWFYIETAYHIAPAPLEERKQLQQDAIVDLHLNVTGGKRNTVYHANITVEFPHPLNTTTYSTMVNLTDTTDTGYGYASIKYPNETLFHPSGSHINYTGLYFVYFNKTQNLAESSFFIGLTNASDYHREEIVEIRAVGYLRNETANITITFLGTNKTLPPISANASPQGIINATWKVPWNASIGDYNITITSENTTKTKPILDSQLFRIPGYQIDIYTRNLAGDAVPQILVEALDNATNTRYNENSTKNGLARLWLEKGNHTLEAFWNKVKVNETQINIACKDVVNLTCELTSVKLTVKDKNENRIPFVNLTISYEYLTTKDSKVVNESRTGETDLFGAFYLNSTLPHIAYVINASRYGRMFNTNNRTIEDLPAKKWFNVTILCPAKTLTLEVKEHHRNPLPNARVELIEQMGGISYQNTTDDAGIATIKCTFGKYETKIYMDNTLLNKTFIEIFNDTHIEVYCKLYNLTVSVKVVDYFGQPIPEANVTLQRDDLQNSSLTKSNGIATFNNIIGGDLQMMVHLHGQLQPCAVATYYIDESTTIEIKLGRYVFVAGFLVETGQLTVASIIAAAVVLIVLIEVYKRKRVKSQKDSS